jgi:hypothetical protein
MGQKQRQRERQRRLEDALRYKATASRGSAPGGWILTPPWLVDELKPCPCGTGESFVKCCKAYLPETPNLYISNPSNEPKVSERICRGGLTKYIGYVFGHTLPMLAAGMAASEAIVSIDVEAVDGFVDGVARCLRAQGRSAEAILLFDHISRTIPLPGLSQRMLAVKAGWVAFVLDEQLEAKSMLIQLDQASMSDSELLEVYVGIVQPSSVECVQLLDRAWKSARQPVSRLYNASTKALHLIMLFEADAARQAMADAFGEYRLPALDSASVLEKQAVARAYSLKWWLDQRSEDLAAALLWYSSVPIEELVESARADLHHTVGGLLGDSGDHNSAIARLHLALEYGDAQHSRIRLAEEYLRADRISDALRLLNGIEPEKLERSLHLEYHSILAMLAVRNKNELQVRAQIDAIQKLDIPAAYFRAQRDRICIDLLMAIDREAGTWSRPANVSRMLAMLSRFLRFCDYLELKPNVFGVGVNLNKIAESLEIRFRQVQARESRK